MFKSVHTNVWVFDIEWIPDAIAGKNFYGLSDSMSEKEVWEVMWLEAGGDEKNPRPFLKTSLCRIVSIAAVGREQTKKNEPGLWLMSLPENPVDEAQQGEADIISRFLNGIGKTRPQLVGYNSSNADIKILIQRGVAHGISAAGFSHRPNKPWEGFDYFSHASEGHIDLMSILGGWGKSTHSLNEMAVVSGIPGKFDMAGDDVSDKWLEGKLEEIVHYNEFDALTTYLLWLRMAHFGGHFNSEQYEGEQESVRALLRQKLGEKPHLEDYLKRLTAL